MNRSDRPTYSLGLDPSLTGFGVVFQPINHQEWYGYTLSSEAKGSTDSGRAVALGIQICQDIDNLPYKPAVATFENYGPINKTSGKITARAEICGIIKAHLLHVLRIPVILISPNALKSVACPNRSGKGFASKEEMLQAAAAENYFAQTDDEADAYFCSKIGTRLYFNQKAGCSFERINPE